MSNGAVARAEIGSRRKLNAVVAALPSVRRRLAWWLEGFVLWLVWRIASLMPVDWASALGGKATRLIGPFLPKHGKIATNLAVAFPDKSDREIDAFARRAWGNFGRVVAEYPHLATIISRRAPSRLKIVVNGDIQAVVDGSKPAVFVEPHLANWELAAAVAGILGFPLTVVYNPETNPWVTAMLQRRRSVLGCGFVANTGGLRPLVRELAHGRSIGFLTDRRVDSGAAVPFFGVDTSMTIGPARLALKFGCPLVPVRVERTRGARFAVTLHEAIAPDDEAGDDLQRAQRMTRRLCALFETWIRERPDQWFCSKRMWARGAALPS